jgi:chemotaxis methyl-accepting protein methylase
MSGHQESGRAHGTRFFHEPEVFDRIATTLVPELLAHKPCDEPLRAWCAGCATGEDAYALAMVLVEELEARGLGQPIQVFATDVRGEAIAQARHGVFDVDIADAVGSERLARFFHAFSTGYRVNLSLRNKVVFAPHDVARDAPFSRLDLILCRGVLTSFDRALQDRVTRGLERALRPWGYLVVGAAELIPGRRLQRVHAPHPFYRSTGAADSAELPAVSGSGLADAQVATSLAAPLASSAPRPAHPPGPAVELEDELLRAARDELAAARHELDAIRGRLHRTREDTRHKLADLERQVREQQDLLGATGLAVLFVDRDLRIVHHTPSLQELIRVWPHDRGRRIDDLASCLDYRELAGDLRQVLDTQAPIECEVFDRTGRPLLARLAPHRRGDEVIGAVVTFVDVTCMHGPTVHHQAAHR